jgi:hypothetical protein
LKKVSTAKCRRKSSLYYIYLLISILSGLLLSPRGDLGGRASGRDGQLNEERRKKPGATRATGQCWRGPEDEALRSVVALSRRFGGRHRKGESRTMRSRDRKSLEATAYHEAGHAIARWWLGLRFKEASIIPNSAGGTLGHVFGSGLPKWFDPATQDHQPRVRLRATAAPENARNARPRGEVFVVNLG